jgi:hypothetical protein
MRVVMSVLLVAAAMSVELRVVSVVAPVWLFEVLVAPIVLDV